MSYSHRQIVALRGMGLVPWVQRDGKSAAPVPLTRPQVVDVGPAPRIAPCQPEHLSVSPWASEPQALEVWIELPLVANPATLTRSQANLLEAMMRAIGVAPRGFRVQASPAGNLPVMDPARLGPMCAPLVDPACHNLLVFSESVREVLEPMRVNTSGGGSPVRLYRLPGLQAMLDDSTLKRPAWEVLKPLSERFAAQDGTS